MPRCCRSVGLNPDLNNFGFLMLANANNFFIAMVGWCRSYLSPLN